MRRPSSEERHAEAVAFGERAHAYLEAALGEPCFWALTVAFAELGFARTVGVCRTREAPPELVERLRGAGWSIASLPPADVVEDVLLAARLRGAMHVTQDARAKRGTKFPTPAEAARELGVSLPAAMKALRTLDRYTHGTAQVERKLGRVNGSTR